MKAITTLFVILLTVCVSSSVYAHSSAIPLVELKVSLTDDALIYEASPGNRHYSKAEDRLRYVRSASRGWLMPAWPYPKVGFRPVLAPKIKVPEPTIDPKYDLGVLTPYNSGLRKIDLVGFEPTKKSDHAAE